MPYSIVVLNLHGSAPRLSCLRQLRKGQYRGATTCHRFNGDLEPSARSLLEPRTLPMPSTARGTFEVTLSPQEPSAPAAAATIKRMSLEKAFSGDLEGTSTGEMLAFVTDVKGSAGYVAIERFAGSVAGKRGGLVLQHSSTMARGEPGQRIEVVPDSGTEELTGIDGTMEIIIDESGGHTYVFDYSLPEA